MERARRKWAAFLKEAFRLEVLEGTPTRPNLVAITPMDTRSIWRRIGPFTKGDALFELVSEEKVK